MENTDNSNQWLREIGQNDYYWAEHLETVPNMICIAFMLSDMESGITVFQLTATVRTSWYIFTALNKKHLSPRCGSAYILL